MITTPLDSYAIDVLVGAGKVHGFRVMLGCDYRLEASVGLDETAAPCPEERQLKITLTSGRPDEGYFVSLHLGPVPEKLPPSAIWPTVEKLSRKQCSGTLNEQGKAPGFEGFASGTLPKRGELGKVPDRS